MTFSNETEKLKAQIQELQEKLQKLEEIEKQPRMNLQQEGEYAVVSYHDKVYYRLEGEVTFSWYIKKGVSVGYPVPTLMMVNDAETERLLEGLYYNHIQVKKEKEQQKEEKVEPSMINCVLLGNPPDGYVAWNVWYDEVGSKGILHNLKISDISAKEYQQKEEFEGNQTWVSGKEQKWDVVRESLKWCEEHPDKDPLDWLKPQTPEQTAQSLKEAFVKAQQTEKWKETQKLIDEEDNDKNFKNSLDLIKEWGEKNKPLTLYEILMDWWIHHLDMMEQSDERIIDDLVNIIGEKFIPPSNDRNGYEWNKCLELMRGKLR